MTMNRSMPSDWTSSLGNGGAIGTGQRAGDPSTGGSQPITEARDTFQGTRERPEGSAQASDDSDHSVDGTGYAETNEDVGQSSEHESGQFSGLPKSQYGHDATRGDKGGDVASVELMSDVGYASLASPMGAAITSLMRNPAGEIKHPTTMSASPSLEGGELEKTTNLKKGEELLARKESKEKETKRKAVERCVQSSKVQKH